MFTNTQAKVKSMGKTLELMGELQSDDMQKRHWEELSNETKHDIKPEDPNFKFYDLFKLNLIHYTEKVSDIVEIANHQTKIKKSLDKIKKQWDEKSFDWEEITEKETYSLQKTEEVIELVDQDLGNLLNMLGRRNHLLRGPRELAHLQPQHNQLTRVRIRQATEELEKIRADFHAVRGRQAELG